MSGPSVGLLHVRQRQIGFRPAVAEELPGVAGLLDEVEIHVMDQELVLVPAGDRLDHAARVDEIALAVEFADIPRRFLADPVDRADIDAVRHRRGRLFEFPEIFGQAGDGGRKD